MKRFILIFTLLLFSCEQSEFKKKDSYYGPSLYNIIEIDDCEYIKISYGLAHKGNCKNSIHYQNERNN